MQSLSRRTFLRMVGGGLVAAPLLAACGGGGAAPTTAPAKPTEAAKPAEAKPTEAVKPAAPAAAPTTPSGGPSGTAAPAVSSGTAFGKSEDPSPELWWVRDVQMSGGWTVAAEDAAAVAIGQQKSFFEQEGLTPVMKPFVTGTDLPNMMAAGQVKIATGSGSLGISVIAAGVKARVICGHCDIAGNQGLTIRKGSGIEQPADLAGKKIGMTTGASITLGMRRFAKEQNLDISKISFVNGQPPDLIAAFGKGDIDGYAGWEPWLTNTQKLGGTQWIAGNKRFLNGKEEPAEYLLLHSYVVVMEDYLQKNPNTVAAFLRGLKKGVDFINSNPDQAVDLLVEPMRIQKEDLTKMVSQVKYDLTVDDRLIRGMNDQVDFLLELGRIPRKIEPKEYMDVSILERQYPELVKWRA